MTWSWKKTLLALAVCLYVVYFTVASFLRYANFYTGRFDLGNMDQVVWNTAHGRIFQMTDPDSTQITSRLSVHADFLLILLAPFYEIWQDPRMLLLIQTVVLAGGGIAVYLIANEVLEKSTLSLIFALAFLANPLVQFTNLYDFHAVTLATTFFLMAWYCLLKKHFWWTLFFVILVGISKEQVWAAVGLFSLYAAWRIKDLKQRSFWLAFAVFSLGFFWFLIAYAIPHVRGSAHFALATYSELGDSPASILKTALFSPLQTLSIVVTPDKLHYLFQLIAPLGLLSLLSPFQLVFALPDFAVNLLSNDTQFIQIYYQYTALITPFVFISSIYGAKFAVRKLAHLPHRLGYKLVGIYIVVATLITAYQYGPLPGSSQPNVTMFTQPVSNRATIDTFLRSIPSNYSVAASNNVGSHLSQRQAIYTIPIGVDQADIVVFLLNDPNAQPSLAAQKQMAADLETNPAYITLVKNGDLEAFAKKSANVQLKSLF